MIILDTDTFTLLLMDHHRVAKHHEKMSDAIAITAITRVETLQGRFATLLKAANGAELRIAQERLVRADIELLKFKIIPIDVAASMVFDRLREDKRLKKIGRADLLIACIALANGATLVTRNLKHFKQVPGLKIENWAD